MKKTDTTSVLHDLMTRLKEHDVEMSTLRKVLDAQLIQLARLQAEVDVLHARESLNAPGSQQGSIASSRFTDRQEALFSAARGLMWQP